MTALGENLDKCVLCGDDLSCAPCSTVHKKGLERFIACSQVRGDGLAERWIGRESEVIHEKCRVRYGAIKNVEDKLKRKFSETEFIDNSGGSSLFNFREYCFICAEHCSEEHEKKKRCDKRRRVSKVSGKTQLEDKVRAAAMKIDDAKGKVILDRLKENINLAAEGAVYHSNCLALFLQRNPKVSEPYRQFIDAEWADYFKKVCRKIDEFGKQQFLVEELFNDMGKNPPSMQHFKTMLAKQYGENILFSSRGNKKSIITFRCEADRILLNHYAAQVMSSKIKPTKKNPPHDEVLEQIPCHCSTNCTNLTCSCRRSGSQCTFACKNCYHANCENAAPAYIDEEDDGMDAYDIPDRVCKTLFHANCGNAALTNEYDDNKMSVLDSETFYTVEIECKFDNDERAPGCLTR